MGQIKPCLSLLASHDERHHCAVIPMFPGISLYLLHYLKSDKRNCQIHILHNSEQLRSERKVNDIYYIYLKYIL